VLILESDQVGFFSEEDTHFVNQLLNQTLIALDNTRLFRDIRRNRDRLEVILNNMDEAVILMNDRGQIVLANPGVRLLGLMPNQLIDHTIQELCQQDDLNLWRRTGFDSPEAMLDLIANINTLSGSSSDVVYTITGEQSLLYIERDIIPILGDRGTPIGLLLIFHNKTQEQELDQQRENISRMIIHDLRSPLTAVTTSMRLLQDLVPEDNEFRPLVEKTTDASQRAIRKLLIRVDSLLDISRMESGELRLETEPTELATLADNVCMELSPLANDLQVTLLSDFPENLPSVNIDADKVERLLLNLVDNALKYSPEKTTIAIRAAAETIGSNTENQVVRVEVIDQGPGIPDDQKENLFGRFVQVAGRQSVRRGVGLGLAFCKMVADAHGGRIWVEDNAGGGSIFVFTLPVIIAKSEQ
jgi:signal transduction histidine kinase